MIALISFISFISCLTSDIVLAQPVPVQKQQSKILTELNSHISTYEFWNLMMIETISAERGAQATDEILAVIQEQFNRINGKPTKVTNGEDFLRLYNLAITKPCTHIKSTYDDNKSIFETTFDTMIYDEIVLYKDIAQICENLLLIPSKQNEFLQKMLAKQLVKQ